jgi:hypothetical protein
LTAVVEGLKNKLKETQTQHNNKQPSSPTNELVGQIFVSLHFSQNFIDVDFYTNI